MDFIVCENVLVAKGIEKLYLSNRRSDVAFIFEHEATEKVPAHKCILSTISSKFEELFDNNDGDIVVADVSPNAFKEKTF